MSRLREGLEGLSAVCQLQIKKNTLDGRVAAFYFGVSTSTAGGEVNLVYPFKHAVPLKWVFPIVLHNTVVFPKYYIVH